MTARFVFRAIFVIKYVKFLLLNILLFNIFNIFCYYMLLNIVIKYMQIKQ